MFTLRSLNPSMRPVVTPGPFHGPAGESRTRRALVQVLAIVWTVLSLLLPATAGAAVPSRFDFSWVTAPEPVAPGVTALSASGGCPMIRTESTCAIAFAQDGDIWLAYRGGDGWASPLRVTDDPADSRNPQLVLTGLTLHVIWEDDRSGHTEVMARRWDGITWSVEEVLGPDDSPSRLPSAAALDTDAVFVVWQEGPEDTAAIAGRSWHDGQGWGALEVISQSPARALEPSAANGVTGLCVAWADTRHGQAEIYFREKGWQGWGAETRLTDLSGNCRRPSLHAEYCCYDYIVGAWVVAFENDLGGVPEVWSLRWDGAYGMPAPEQLSAADGVPSHSPNANGFTFLWDTPMGGLVDRFDVTWTDGLTTETRTHRFSFDSEGDEVISASGEATSVTAACEGQPYAQLAFAWIQDDGQGVPWLTVRQGRARGCSDPQYSTFRNSLLIAPNGEPSNTVRAMDNCPTPMPHPDQQIFLSFDAELNSQLTWDAQQPHPQTPAVVTDEEGYAHIPVRGGGCQATGQTYVIARGVQVRALNGAKSPDVNGDCGVHEDDRAYFVSMLGTSDFCADLDESGTVDAADLAIVDATLGDLCSQAEGVDEPGGAGSLADLRLFPNPCSERVSLVLRSGGTDALGAEDGAHSPRTQVEVFDASGRFVRTIAAATVPGPSVLTWDTRDADGRAVPSGVYFVRVRHGGDAARRTVLVVR